MNMQEFMKNIGLSSDCIEEITVLYDKIKSDKEIKDIVSVIENHGPIDKVHSGIEEYAKKTGLDNKSVNLAIVCSTWYVFKRNYEEKGISDDFFWECMLDIKYQTNDCRNFYGVWGVISMYWFDGYYRAERVALGRLQFEKVSFEYDDCIINGTLVCRGDAVINIHIPSSGPLNPEEVEESLKRALLFFDCKKAGKMIFICKSWFLYPGYECIFSEKSNIYKFRKLFNIFSTVEHENFSSGCLRVFYKDVTCNIEELPTETSLQKAFYDYMKKQDSKYGLGCGAIIMNL